MSKRHERLLFRYSAALERGDFDAVGAVLREAERDPALEAKILQLNDAYAAEQSARFDHTNPKEFPMIAALYQNRKSTPARTSRRVYSLPLVAALAVVALVSVVLSTRLGDNAIWNSGQKGSPEATLLQIIPAECALTGNDESTLDLYSRPSADALVIHQYVALYVPASALRQLDATEAEGETWYYVDISDRGTTVRGWVTAEAYDRNVRCAPLVNTVILTQVADAPGLVEALVVTATPVPFQPTALPPNQVALPTLTPSPYNEESLWLTGEAMSDEATALPPTVVPPNQVALATATPFPFQIEATALPPTVVPPSELALPTATPFPLDPATPTLSPVVVPATASELPDFPVYFVREGDTLLSIVQMFGFDESMLDDLRITNRLSADDALTPGQALVIPVNMPDPVTTCIVKPDRSFAVLLQPSGGENTIVATLPGRSRLEIIGEHRQANGAWYVVIYRSPMESMLWGMVDVNLIDLPEDCSYYGQDGSLYIPEATFVATATPLPSLTPTPAS